MQPTKPSTKTQKLYFYDQSLLSSGYLIGIDEAGRGPLAGPVVAAAVVLPKNHFIEGVDDSKRLSHLQRVRLFDQILEHALDYGIGIVDHTVIDQINIYQAAKKAMIMALQKIEHPIDLILTDHLPLIIPGKKVIPITKGDSKSASIAAASIIAKVTRDKLMEDFHLKYPQYGFNKHKGYPTKEHKKMLTLYGPSPIHRKTFNPVRSMLEDSMI